MLLGGSNDTRGNLAMIPDLANCLGEELAKEVLAQKERRQACEERATAAGKIGSIACVPPRRQLFLRFAPARMRARSATRRMRSAISFGAQLGGWSA